MLDKVKGWYCLLFTLRAVFAEQTFGLGNDSTVGKSKVLSVLVMAARNVFIETENSKDGFGRLQTRHNQIVLKNRLANGRNLNIVDGLQVELDICFVFLVPEFLS